ncbi:hypothetical protein F2Q68_00024081 [Brassica cretica]|uniref:RING-type domain-containing protein n=1 Tax=Brassica cretica TaxID=69181 RepID=A0A8S9I611_BRACR|nr:hypothetical protein F2Q68_00024081 [Brassica cretica]
MIDSASEALMHLASCGRSASYVLIPCGHASLCTECSQMCDVCPICRSSLLRTGDRLRLYYECVEAGLISEEDEDEDEHQLAADVHRLYSLFDVAMNNSLISVVCDSVSSDSVIAFLLDEVVVKDWGTFLSILAELQHIYSLETKEMQAWLDNLLKYSKQVSGICSVIEVMESAFKGSVSPQLEDVQKLRENIGKTKQALVLERKSNAIKRAWPNAVDQSSDCNVQGGSLFIEDALENLEREPEYSQDIGAT